MIYDNSLIKEINERISERKKNAERKAEEYALFLERDKDYSKALQRFNSAKFDLSRARFDKDEAAEKKADKEIKKAANEMEKRASALNISSEMLTPNYYCKNCGDTGFLPNGKRCSCFKKLAIEITFDELGISKRNFPNFGSSENYPYNELGKIYSKFETYCENFSEKSKNIVISGSVGTGKSRLVGCMANELLSKGFNVVFLSACELNSVFLKYHTAPVSDKAFYLSLLTGCDLLIVDDLGTEPVFKNVTEEYLLMVLSERISKGMPYVITTNLTQTMLLDRYGDRILSRLNDKHSGIRIEINGEDLRRKK